MCSLPQILGTNGLVVVCLFWFNCLNEVCAHRRKIHFFNSVYVMFIILTELCLSTLTNLFMFLIDRLMLLLLFKHKNLKKTLKTFIVRRKQSVNLRPLNAILCDLDTCNFWSLCGQLNFLIHPCVMFLAFFLPLMLQFFEIGHGPVLDACSVLTFVDTCWILVGYFSCVFCTPFTSYLPDYISRVY